MADPVERTAVYHPGDPPPPGAPADDPVPPTVGRFEVRRVLGQGGFGTVYLGFDPGLHREVAIKVPSRDALSAAYRERFMREARAVAGVHHPNVCPVFEVGEEAGRPYLVLKYVPGPTLADWLAGRHLPPADAVRLLTAIADGVAAAHAVGVVHRDLKPANVILAPGDVPVVTDFGLARTADAGGAFRTAAGLVVGTPGYMSPEQAAGERDLIGPPTDVYALGVMLYEVLAGRPPFVGPVTEVLRAKLTRDPDPPSAARPGLPPSLDAVCERALARQPDDRYQTVAEFAAALRAAVPSQVPAPPPAPTRWVWMVIGAFLLLGAVVAALWFAL
jgi:serine/threonine-protein kinase